MSALIINGKAYAAKLRQDVAKDVEALKEKSGGKVPGLAVVIVGDDPASHVYVRNKKKSAAEAGLNSFDFPMPADTQQDELIARIEQLNNDPDVHGILVQLPLPDHLDETAVIEAILPEKDVDGFHVVNRGKLVTGQDCLVPCTPLGCIMLLKDQLGDLSGKHAVVVGRSNIVGKPMAQLLLNENCTVTICHSRTENIKGICREADILVAAIGKPHFVGKDWVKPGATVIDVGINRTEGIDGTHKLVGDVDFGEVQYKAHAITPVPGGVGPMTIACLLKNTVTAFERIEDL